MGVRGQKNSLNHFEIIEIPRIIFQHVITGSEISGWNSENFMENSEYSLAKSNGNTAVTWRR